MSNSFSVKVGEKTVAINVGDKIDDIKNKFKGEDLSIFDGIDTNSDGDIDADEIVGLKNKLKGANYEVEELDDAEDNTPAHGNASARAYNSAIQNLRNKYNAENLGRYFLGGEEDLYTVQKGDTLYAIVKRTLEEEGLPTDYRTINNRIAEIANVNNISDVNNIRIGTKLIVKLTAEGISRVKNNDNNSAKAFSETTGANVSNAPTSDKKSTITPTKNGLNMGSGVPVDENGSELKNEDGTNNFKDPKFKAGGYIMKYTNPNHDPDVMYQITYNAGAASMFKGVKLSAPTIQELKDLKTKFEAEAKKIETAPDNENDEAKAARMATNLTALKELVTLTGGNEQVIKNVAEKLRGDSYVDRKSNDYKAFVQDLLLTRNADVVSALTPIDGDNVDMSVVENDRTSHEYLAGMYQEIREKEKAGEKLSADEVKLKDALVNTQFENGFKLEANDVNHVNEKYLNYGSDGRLLYATYINDIVYWASDEKLLDEFVNKLKTADTDEKKAALFKEYANTKDVELARCLMGKAKSLNASDEDIKTVINANGMPVLAQLDRSDNSDWSDDIKNAMNARIKDIYTKDKGNLENAEWLGAANEWINKLPEDQQEAARTEIAETYFEKTTTKDDAGNDKTEYTFNPKRRPTKEEMTGLCAVANDDMKKAMGNYIKLEDMGKGQFNEAIERTNYGDGNNPVVEPYADMVDGMSDKKEVLDFIDNKIATDKNYNIPYDKILEKFSDDKDIKDKLLEHVDRHSTISDKNRLALAKTYMKEENGRVSLDKTKLPKGASPQNILNALPDDCKTGDAEKYFRAALKELGEDDLKLLTEFADKNENAVKDRIAELVNANKSDNVFIQNVCKLDDKITPYQDLYEVNATDAGWNDETKQAVFEIFNGRIEIKDKQDYLDGAVKSGLATKVAEDRYQVGANIYQTSGYYDTNNNNNADDNETIWLQKYSKVGYENGIKLYNALEGAGSGDTAKMLKGEGEYENFVTADNVIGLILGFDDKSPNEGIMQYIANEWTTIPQATCIVIPNKLMEKAKAVDAELKQNNSEYSKIVDSDEYKKLADFVKEHQDTAKGYSEDDGKILDNLIYDLVNAILCKF